MAIYSGPSWIDTVWEESAPLEIFRIDKVLTIELGGTGKVFAGDLVFADKAICFLGYIRFASGGGSGAERVERQRKAVMDAHALSQQEITRPLKDTIRSCSYRLVLPRSLVTNIKYSWGNLVIKTLFESHGFVLWEDRHSLWEELKGRGRHRYSGFQEQIFKYLRGER